MYAGLAVLVVRACAGGHWSRVTPSLAGLAVTLTVAYGATDEFHQRFVAGRTADLADLAADAAGATVAAILVLLVTRLGKSGPGARI
jgi:VanZ family protein